MRSCATIRSRRLQTPGIERLECRITPSGFDALAPVPLHDNIGAIVAEIASRPLDATSQQKVNTPISQGLVSSENVAEESGMSMPMWGMPPMDEGIMSQEQTLESPPLFPNLIRFSMKRSALGRMTLPMRRGSVESTMTMGISSRIIVPQQAMGSAEHPSPPPKSWRRDDTDAAIMEMYGEEEQVDQDTDSQEDSPSMAPDAAPKMADPFVDPEAPNFDMPLNPELSIPLTPEASWNGETPPAMKSPQELPPTQLAYPPLIFSVTA